MSPRRFLITGGAGFIGSSLAARLVSDKRNVVAVVDNLTTGHRENLPKVPNLKFFQVDANQLAPLEKVFRKARPQIVFHYSALVGVARTIKKPLTVIDELDGIRNVAMLSKKYHVEHIYYASSSEVYGDPERLPENEATTPLNAHFPYAVVKVAGETIFRSFREAGGANYTNLRFFNTYGPKQNNGFVVSKFIKTALAGGNLKLFGRGRQTRSFCYIDDNLDATLAIMRTRKFTNSEVNIGCGKEITIRDLAKLIVRLTNSKSKITLLKATRADDPARRRPDLTRMKTVFKRQPTPLQVGLHKVIASFKSSPR